MITKVLEQPGEPCLVVCRGKGASSTYNRMLGLICLNSIWGWRCPQTLGPCSMLLIARPRKNNCKRPSKSMPYLLHAYRHGWKRTWLRSVWFLISLWNTGERSGQPPAWRESTKRSAGEREWLGCSQAKLPVSDWSRHRLWISARSDRSENNIALASH